MTQNLPGNIHDYVGEIGGALCAMYGPDAEAAYVESALNGYTQLFGHPDVRVWSCEGTDTPGLLVYVTRRGVGHITLLHVLEGESGTGIESALLRAAVEHMRGRGLRAIIGEFVRYRPLGFEVVFSDLGFQRYDRELLIADLAHPNMVGDRPLESVACGSHEAIAAAVLVDAYRQHPSRPLHPEAHDLESASAFLAAFRDGGFGPTAPELFRLWMDGTACSGFVLGAEAAPGVGFIPHVAVANSAQGRGIGGQLVRETAAIFRAAGYGRIALGVTIGNPAARLYARLGFEPLLPVETYVWWADGAYEASC